jgi:hypothetical protein
MKSGSRCLLVLLLPGLLLAQAKDTPTFEEILSLKMISSPKTSPDGRFVAYQVAGRTGRTTNTCRNGGW